MSHQRCVIEVIREYRFHGFYTEGDSQVSRKLLNVRSDVRDVSCNRGGPVNFFMVKGVRRLRSVDFHADAMLLSQSIDKLKVADLALGISRSDDHLFFPVPKMVSEAEVFHSISVYCELGADMSDVSIYACEVRFI